MAVDTITRDEVQAFAQKLEEFGAKLLPKEKALLQEILWRAAGGDADEVEGHGAMRTSIAAAVLAAVAGVGATAASSGGHVPSVSYTQQSAQPGRQAAHPGGYWVVDDKGGMEYIRYP